MDSERPRRRHHPTFPLDREEIRRERWRIALTAPLTWLSVGAVIAFGLLFKLPGPTVAIALAVVAVALFFFWRAQTRYLERRIAGHLINKSNREQDTTITEQMAELSNSGREGYAITLGKFLQLKQAIEAELHSDGKATEDEKNVEGLVDTLCAGVCEQFQAITRIERRQAAVTRSDEEYSALEESRRELLGQVIDSFKSLKRTSKELAYILDPTKVAAAHEKPARDLGELAENLRAEEEIARRTRERMARDAVEL